MCDRRKVLFTSGMEHDGLLVITDAPREEIVKWCIRYLQESELGKSIELFDTLKENYYVKVLLDSEEDGANEDMEAIGHDECYALDDICRILEEELQRPKKIAEFHDVLVGDLLPILEQYQDKKLSLMGSSSLYMYITENQLILDEVNNLE